MFASTQSAIARRIVSWVVGLSCLVGLLIAPQPVWAAPTISLNPASGQPGNTIIINGNGFEPGRYNGTVRWDGADQFTFAIPSGGVFSVQFTIPNATPGNHTVTVCANCGGGEFEQSASTKFDVQPVVPPSDTPPPSNTPQASNTSPPASGDPPIINSFMLDSPAVEPGGCTFVRWTTSNGVSARLTGDFDITVEPNGSWQLCPPATQVYRLTITGSAGASPNTVIAEVTLAVGSTATSTPTPSLTPTATLIPPTRTFTALPTLTFTATATRTLTPTRPVGSAIAPPIVVSAPPPIQRPLVTVPPLTIPGVCTSLDLGPGGITTTFDDQRNGGFAYVEAGGTHSAEFINNHPYVGRPTVATHSGAQAVYSDDSGFGSAYRPITIRFRELQTAVGLYAGREAPLYEHEPLTAVLTAYSYDSTGQWVVVDEDTLVLPAEATPVQRCLVVRAQTGIRTITVEYLTQAGNSAADRRWIDDLTLLPSGQSGSNRPPEVTIREPASLASIYAPDVQVVARIHEDIGLNEVTAYVGSRFFVMRVAPVSGSDPTLYEARVSIPASAFTVRATNSIRVVASDWPGERAEASVSFVFHGAPLDIEVTALEANQVVQCMYETDAPTCGTHNTVPLYINKPTLVRAYVRSIGTPPTAPMWGRLCLNETSECVRSLAGVQVQEVANPVAEHRADLSQTLNFLLPASFSDHTGQISYTVYLNETGAYATETSYTNNQKTERVAFRDSDTWEVKFIPVNANGFPSVGNMAVIAGWLRQVYPINPRRLRILLDSPITGTWDFAAPSGFGLTTGCSGGWDNLNEQIAWRRWSDWRGGKINHYGMVNPAAVTGAFAGCGGIGIAGASGDAAPDFLMTEEIAAQELGHNFGRRHAPGCTTPFDPSYPNRTGLLDAWGLDVLRMRLFSPVSTYDFMGYCGGDGTTWVSSYTYNSIGRLFVSGNARPGGILADPLDSEPWQSQTATDVLVASGNISPQSVDIHYGFVRLSAAPETTSGPYTLELANASGEVLWVQPFSPVQLSNSSAGNSGLFLISVPWLEGVTTAVFRYEGTEIARRIVSPNAPTVNIITPNGGETWPASGPQTISWTASDGDGDPLTFIVQYSPDNGLSWKSLAENVIVTNFKIDAADITGGNAGLIRVLASDGFNTSQDTSDQTFTVEGKAPSIFILSPDNGYTLPEGTLMLFSALAFDREEADMADGTAFHWSSDLDGDLGQGLDMYLNSLSRGTHTVTLRVTDRDGREGLAQVIVNVTEPLEGNPDIVWPTPLPLSTSTPNSETEPVAGQANSEQPRLLIGAGLGLCSVLGLFAIAGGLLLALRLKR